MSVNVFAFNSKKYYVITEGAGLGDTVTMFPVTGNETVLDAIANVNGLEDVSSKSIWVARPTSDTCKMQILPVDWRAITAQGATGHQLPVDAGRSYLRQARLDGGVRQQPREDHCTV